MLCTELQLYKLISKCLSEAYKINCVANAENLTRHNAHIIEQFLDLAAATFCLFIALFKKFVVNWLPEI